MLREHSGHSQALSDFCWSCGAAVTRHSEGACLRCGTSRVRPRRDRDSLLGVRVRIDDDPVGPVGVVIEDSVDPVGVLLGTQRVDVRRQEVRAADEFERIRATGPIYRLYAEGERDLAVSLLKDVVDRRSFASDAMTHLDRSAITDSHLSADEVTWLQMWVEHNSGDRDAAALAALALPPGAYPDKLVVIARGVGIWAEDPQLRHRARTAAAALPGQPGASLLEWLAGDDDSDGLVAALDEMVEWRQWFGLNPNDRDAACILEGRAARDEACAAIAGWMDTTEARTVRLLSGAPHDADGRAGLPVWAYSEALKRGLVSSTEIRAPGVTDHLSPTEREHLLGQVRAIDLDPEERQRLAFLGSAPPVADDLAHPATRKYELLSALRDGDPRVVGELSAMLSPDDRTTAIAVGRSLASGEIDPAAVVDPTTWPTLTPLVLSGELAPDAEPQVVDMAGWVLLEEATRAAFSWDFESARTLAERCRRLVDDEPRQDEALSILACCAWMQGEEQAAESLLREAIADAASESLLVNYAVVAAQSSPGTSIEALNRLLGSSDDPAVRCHAALNSAERTLLLHGGDVLPRRDVILQLRRSAVSDTSLEVHARVMSILSWADPQWVADPENTRSSPHFDSPAHRSALFSVSPMSQRVKVLADELAARPNDVVLLRERSRLLEELVDELSDASTPEASLVELGFEVVDAGLLVHPFERVVIPALSVRMALWDFYESTDDEAPPIEWIELLEAAEGALADLDDREAEETMGSVVSATFGMWAVLALRHWHPLLLGMSERYTGAVAQYQYLIDEATSARDEEPVREQLRQQLQVLLPEVDTVRARAHRVLIRVSPDDERRSAIEETATFADELWHEIRETLE